MREFKDLKIAVAGTGYVGLSIATLLSQHHKVTAVDIIPEKVELLNSRKSPIQDEYIVKYLAEQELDLTATLDVTESTLKAGVENDYEHADNVTSKLTLSGKPNKTVSESGSKIGTITITVSPENYEN